jgi:WD40 repeat protein
LGISDFHLIDSANVLRVLTCSSDRSFILYDVHNNRSLVKIPLSDPLECITCNFSLDFIVSGSSSGKLFIADFSLISSAVSLNNSSIEMASVGNEERFKMNNSMIALSSSAETASVPSCLPYGIQTLAAHSKTVSSLLFLPDNITLVSSSIDGSLSFWNLHLKQLLKEIFPLNRSPVSNCTVSANVGGINCFFF